MRDDDETAMDTDDDGYKPEQTHTLTASNRLSAGGGRCSLTDMA